MTSPVYQCPDRSVIEVVGELLTPSGTGLCREVQGLCTAGSATCLPSWG